MGGGLGLIIVCIIVYEILCAVTKKWADNTGKEKKYYDSKGNANSFDYYYDEEADEYKKIG